MVVFLVDWVRSRKISGQNQKRSALQRWPSKRRTGGSHSYGKQKHQYRGEYSVYAAVAEGAEPGSGKFHCGAETIYGKTQPGHFQSTLAGKEIISHVSRIAFEDYATEEIPMETFINSMVGDLQRIRVYPEKDSRFTRRSPLKSGHAYEQLVALGFDRFVIKIMFTAPIECSSHLIIT